MQKIEKLILGNMLRGAPCWSSLIDFCCLPYLLLTLETNIQVLFPISCVEVYTIAVTIAPVTMSPKTK